MKYDIDGRIILNWILRRLGERTWTRFFRFRKRIVGVVYVCVGGGLPECGEGTSFSLKVGKFSLLAEGVLAPQ